MVTVTKNEKRSNDQTKACLQAKIFSLPRSRDPCKLLRQCLENSNGAGVYGNTASLKEAKRPMAVRFLRVVAGLAAKC